MPSDYAYIGKSLPGVDAPAKARGEARYTGDLGLPGMLHARILRSPIPHGRIVRIDTARAAATPGVVAVITGQDCPNSPVGTWLNLPKIFDQYILAKEKVRYVGEEIAAVVAEDEDTAAEAIEKIVPELEALPAVFDPEEALKEGAPLVHAAKERNISIRWAQAHGDVVAGFQKARVVREDRFKTQAVSHVALEPHVTLAHYENHQLTVWSSTQVPFYVSRALSIALQLPEERIRVIKPFVGGGFGGKTETYGNEFIAAFLAMVTGRPVRLSFTREEVFLGTRRRHPMILDVKTGVDAEGILTACDCRVIADGGAYTGYGLTPLILAYTFINLPFRIPALKFEGYRVFTNLPISGAQRGFGGIQPRFALESQLDMLAEALGMDPVEIRLKNCIQPGEKLPSNHQIRSCGLRECIEETARISGWQEKRGKLPRGRGIGIGCYGFVSGAALHRLEPHLPHSETSIRIQEDGQVEVFSGAADIGQGSDTLILQIVAEELGIPPSSIRLVAADTRLTRPDMGSYSSRVTLMAGKATQNAAVNVKEKLFAVAAEKLEVTPADLVARGGQVQIAQTPQYGLSFGEVAQLACREAGGPIQGVGTYSPEPGTFMSPTFSFGANVAEVEVDLETGKVRVLKVWGTHDCGVAINPLAVTGQVEGAIGMGLGQALLEEMGFQGGQTFQADLIAYPIPTAFEVPEIETICVPTEDPVGPFGAKEAGEGTSLPIVAAIANAIHDAIGLRCFELPIRPETVLQR
ncbi:MAG: molybdopterin-dependent oxidoreductase [Candidatus Tectomicrobia bacterium]|uniref:Molybdopterin-dependent oxidoreductase n=1 Tax=Tectimicrobiota bacterium TaxID=2528274 RepID=A0A932FW17_UNCTE|nr:molybdopterin-dependent oxidoreductase [Candidatus Tectomicrobia bacterium]